MNDREAAPHEDSSGSLGCLAQAVITLGLCALIVMGFVVVSGFTQQRDRDSLFSEAVSSASASLADPDSPSEEYAWHEGPFAAGGGCVLQRHAWWMLNGRSPERALQTVQAVAKHYSATASVEPLPNASTADPETFNSGFYSLEGSPLYSGYSVRLITGISTDDVLHIVLYGDTC